MDRTAHTRTVHRHTHRLTHGEGSEMHCIYEMCAIVPSYLLPEELPAPAAAAAMQESPATKEDPIYLSMFDWC